MIDELKTYLRLDEDSEEVGLYLHSALSYLKNAGVKIPDDLENEKYAQHRLAIYMLATHFYENRLIVNTNTKSGQSVVVPYAFQALLHQLQWGGEEDGV